MISKFCGSFCAALLAISLPAAAQEQKPATWSIAEAPKSVKPGGKFTVKVKAEISEGWHLYSVTQPEGGPIPTRVWLPEGQPFKAAGQLRGSKPKSSFDDNFGMNVEYYEGSAEFVVPVQAAADAPAGAQKLGVNASFQSCNDKLCLPPRTVKLAADVEIR